MDDGLCCCGSALLCVLSGITPWDQERAQACSHGHGRGGSRQMHSQVHPKAAFPSHLLITPVREGGGFLRDTQTNNATKIQGDVRVRATA